MLPLVGQKLGLANKDIATSLMALCIVAAQCVMVPVAMVVGARADQWGRKPSFLVAFVVLAPRGVLYTFSDHPYWLAGVQLLDGIGAGIFGALFPIVVADLMENTGPFNLAQGAVSTAQSLGAALSTSIAGLIVVRFGDSAAFLFLTAVAAAGLALVQFGMGETRPRRADAPDHALRGTGQDRGGRHEYVPDSIGQAERRSLVGALTSPHERRPAPSPARAS